MTTVICAPDCTCGRHSSRKKHRNEYITGGYRAVRVPSHPLAGATGIVLEHRKVLYDKVGPGPHPCHWLDLYGCGKTELVWGGMSGICADHLDEDRLNNDPANLVVSCRGCNAGRANKKAQLLGPEDVVAIRELYLGGKVNQLGIAEIFGVSMATVSRIVNRKAWSGV